MVILQWPSARDDEHVGSAGPLSLGADTARTRRFELPVDTTSYFDHERPRLALQQQNPLVAGRQTHGMMVCNTQLVTAGKGEDLLARHVAEVLVPGARSPVGGGDLLGAAQHGERRGLDDEQLPARHEQRRHARERGVEIGDVVE